MSGSVVCGGLDGSGYVLNRGVNRCVVGCVGVWFGI